MYQNRAASHERMERWAEATSDCDLSIKNNNKMFWIICTGTARHWIVVPSCIESRRTSRLAVR